MLVEAFECWFIHGASIGAQVGHVDASGSDEPLFAIGENFDAGIFILEQEVNGMLVKFVYNYILCFPDHSIFMIASF